VFGLGVALVGHGVAGPTLIILVLASGAVFGVRSFRRSRSDRNRRRVAVADPGEDAADVGRYGPADPRPGGETEALRVLLVGLDADGWERQTPAEGWAIRDQVSHLAHFDDAAVARPPTRTVFQATSRQLEAGGAPRMPSPPRLRHLAPRRLLDWFDEARRRLLTTFAALDPGLRVPWYGPPMSAASSVTARLMETWAHGQDVADALGVTREPTDRLRHVAHIGVRAMPFSYALHGRPAPTAPVGWS